MAMLKLSTTVLMLCRGCAEHAGGTYSLPEHGRAQAEHGCAEAQQGLC